MYGTTSMQLSYKHLTTYVELGTDKIWLKWVRNWVNVVKLRMHLHLTSIHFHH